MESTLCFSATILHTPSLIASIVQTAIRGVKLRLSVTSPETSKQLCVVNPPFPHAVIHVCIH